VSEFKSLEVLKSIETSIEIFQYHVSNHHEQHEDVLLLYLRFPAHAR
jgi:hypothetical protein